MASRSRNQWSNSSSMSPTRGSPTKCDRPPPATSADPLQPVVGPDRVAQRHPEVVELLHRHQRWRRAVEHDRHHRQFHRVVQPVVDGHEAVVDLHAVGQRRLLPLLDQPGGDVRGEPGIGRHHLLRHLQPDLGRAEVLVVETDRDLRQAVEEEVGEVLPGHHHDGLDVLLTGDVAHLLQGTEEAVGLLPGRRAGIGGHHRGMRRRVRHHDFCHRVFLLGGTAPDCSSSGR